MHGPKASKIYVYRWVSVNIKMEQVTVKTMHIYYTLEK